MKLCYCHLRGHISPRKHIKPNVLVQKAGADLEIKTVNLIKSHHPMEFYARFPSLRMFSIGMCDNIGIFNSSIVADNLSGTTLISSSEI